MNLIQSPADFMLGIPVGVVLLATVTTGHALILGRVQHRRARRIVEAAVANDHVTPDSSWEDVAERASVEVVLETVTAERDRARDLAVRLEHENARLLAERGQLVAEGLLAPWPCKAESDE